MVTKYNRFKNPSPRRKSDGRSHGERTTFPRILSVVSGYNTKIPKVLSRQYIFTTLHSYTKNIYRVIQKVMYKMKSGIGDHILSREKWGT